MDEELLSKKLEIETKLFYFDLKRNPRGKYLKITEKSGDRKHIIVVPETGLTDFRNVIDEIIREM